ncbi:MAG: peptidase M61 [Steroidobacteraceae bacterium]|jgi:predicted metalloprotease with PDZ domain
MKYLILACLNLAVLVSTQGIARAAPVPAAAAAPIAAPKDIAYPGEIRLTVDASDIERRIVRVHESITGLAGDAVLLYPRWLPGEHGPDGPIERLAGLTITAGGASVPWTRDTVDVYAFHLHVPGGTRALEVDFEYLSPTSSSAGPAEFSREILLLEWPSLVLYPAGYFTRQIPAEVGLTLPDGWQFASALEKESSAANRTTFKRTTLETLVDSPLYAGRYTSRIDLDPGAAVPVYMDLFADRPDLLAVKPEQIAIHRALVQQAYKLFASHHYAHYDFLYSLSDQVRMIGLEHHQSSEDGTLPTVFTEWDKQPWGRDLLSHEYTHSWNGKFRRPADLWTPNYNVPMRDTLLWVYEGQTQYWGEVLAARSGLWTRQQALDQWADTAAYFQTLPGSRWRALADTTNDAIVDRDHHLTWRTWQRAFDYYPEGALIWLDADTLIRERSQGKRSLDDFARAFFGIDDASMTPVTYTFEDVVKALNAVEPNDWSAFLRERLDAVNKPPPLGGITRGGYKLVFNDTQSDYSKAVDGERKRTSLLYSVGLIINEKNATIMDVLWEGPAYKAKLTEGLEILAVNGAAYSGEVLKAAVQAAKDSSAPIELIVKGQDRFRVADLDYHGGLRFPHLERDPSVPARLDDLLSPK